METPKTLAVSELVALVGDGRETKISGVAVALVGALSPSGLVSCVLEHGSQYDQTAPDGTLDGQILEARTTTVTAPVTPLVLDGVHFGQDAPLDAPQALFSFGGPGWVATVCCGCLHSSRVQNW